MRTEQALGIGFALKVGRLISSGIRSSGSYLRASLSFSFSQKLNGASCLFVSCRDCALTYVRRACSASMIVW